MIGIDHMLGLAAEAPAFNTGVAAPTVVPVRFHLREKLHWCGTEHSISRSNADE
jgi:hypothetical protein